MRISLAQGHQVLLTAVADTPPAVAAAMPTLSETDRFNFALESPEPDQDYRIAVGDIAPEPALGTPFRSDVLWPEHPYFESARGRCTVTLFSRPHAAGGDWRERAALTVQVLPTKLGEARYQAMARQLETLSAGLLFDLLSKSRSGLGLARGRFAAVRAAQVELRIIERLWATIAARLAEIAQSPETAIRRVARLRACLGHERFGPADIRRLAHAGVDPRDRRLARPFTAVVAEPALSPEILEHGIIRSFLQTLASRVAACQARARDEIRAIERERPYRDRRVRPGPTLFEQFDRPRLAALDEAIQRADRLRARIASAERLAFLAACAPIRAKPDTPIFRHVGPYRAVRDAITVYASTATVVADSDIEERNKPTSRLYEQWVFLQIGAALGHVGLTCHDQAEFVARAAAQTYSVEFRRGARLDFVAPDGHVVRLQYEPWILPAAKARAAGAPVYRGLQSDVPWSPDVLLLLFEPRRDGVHELVYGVAIDAKYSARASESQWDAAGKYLEIRDSRTDRQIVHQVWLALPTDIGIRPRDEAVMWTPNGPNRPTTDFVQGQIGLCPSADAPADSVTPTAAAFAAGLLSYLGIAVDAGTLGRGERAA